VTNLVFLVVGLGLSLGLAGVAAGMGRQCGTARGSGKTRGAGYALLAGAVGTGLGVCGAGLMSDAALRHLPAWAHFAGLIVMLSSLPVGLIAFLVTGSTMIHYLRGGSAGKREWRMLAAAGVLSGGPAATWIAVMLAEIYRLG